MSDNTREEIESCPLYGDKPWLPVPVEDSK